MQTLTREDIVSKRIASVYRGPWSEDEDGYAGCRVFIRLEDGIMFELASQDPDDILPIEAVQRLPDQAIELQSADIGECLGATVEEVLVSDYWPSFGLLLSGNKFLFMSDRLTPRRVGPCILDVDSVYGRDDVLTYWERNPL